MIDHKIEVCEELDINDCSDDDEDWTILVADHPQEASSTRSNVYNHDGLAAGSTRHYRVSSRNADGPGPSRVASGTTMSMPTSADCTGARWSAYMTVGSVGLYNDQGYKAAGPPGGLDDIGALTNYSFSLGVVSYTVNELWYSHPLITPTRKLGRVYFPSSYHLALSKRPDQGKLEDLTLHVGGTALPLSEAGYSAQSFGEAYRWSTEQITNVPAGERPTSMYDGTFVYRDGDSVEVCLTDSAPIVTLELTPDSISESGAANSSTVTATVEQGLDTEFTVTVSAEAESPAADDDFTLSGNTLTFAANALQSTGTVTITANDNNVYEPGKTVQVSGELSEGARPSPPSPVILDIEEDDRSPELSLSVDPDEISEDGGESTLVTVSTGTAFPDTQTITLTIDSKSTATETDDYTVSSKSLTLGAKQTEVTATITAEDDSFYEGDETITVAATHGTSEVGEETITIKDSETAPALTIANAEADEGAAMSFEVELSGAVGSVVEVSYLTSNGSGEGDAGASDYTAASGTLTFRPGEALRQTVSVDTTEDTLDEPDEEFTVTLTVPDGVTVPAGVTVQATAATGTIRDDDVLSAAVSRAAASVVEGQWAEFPVTVSDGTSTADVVVAYTVGGSASEGTDYTEPSGELTITSPATSGTIRIETLDDGVLDRGETLQVSLTGASTGTRTVTVDDTASVETEITDSGTVTVSVTALIVEDDDPGTTNVVEMDDKSIVEEGQSAMFVVELSGSVAKQVLVSYETGDEDDTAKAGTDKDYTGASGTLAFTASQTSKTISVVTLNDDLVEADETFTVKLTGVTAPDGVGVSLDEDADDATGTITDNDALRVSVAPEETPVDEGDIATFIVSLSDSTRAADVVVVYEVGGSATAPSDYVAPDGTLTIGSGSTSGTIDIQTETDYVLEIDETLIVTLQSATSTGGPVTLSKTAAEITIENTTTAGPVPKEDEFEPVGNSASVQVSSTVRSVTTKLSVQAAESARVDDSTRIANADSCKFPCMLEGSSRSVTFVLRTTTKPPQPVQIQEGHSVVIPYDTSGGTATPNVDYTASNGALTYTPTVMENSVPLNITDDTLHEEDETFTLTLHSANLPDMQQTAAFIAEITIRDNDPQATVETNAGPTVALRSLSSSPATGTFTVNIVFSESVTGFDSTGDITVTNGSARDLEGSGASYTVRITPRDEFHGHVTVTVPADAAFDDANNGNRRGSEPFEVDTRLVQVDVSFGAAAYTALEDGSPATVTVLLSADPERTLVIPLTVRNGKGASDADYTGVPNQVTFASGQTSTTFTVTATSDLDEDAGETVTLGFGELPAAVSTGSPDRATITLAGESSKTRYARVMRTLLPRAAAAMSDATVGAISNRIDNVGSQGNLSLAGVNVLPSASVAAQERSADAISWASRDQTTRNISSAQLMDGSSFVMTLADRARLAGAADPSGSNPGTAALWGSGDYRNLAGSQNALAWRGNLVSLHLGADLVALPELVAGVAVARSLVGFDYTDRTNPRTVTGKFETDLLSVHPYASWTPVFGLGFWATGGVGWGGVGIDDNLDVRRTSTTRLLTGALGGSSRLLSVDGLIPGGATALRLKGEGFVTQTLAEENGPIVAQDVGVQRVRLALEGSHEQRGLWGSILTPALEVGLRHDGGDAAQGAGLELGGELRYVHPQLGLTVEGRGRVLTTHRAATEEWGVGGKIQLELGADRQGLSLSLAPSLGVAASGTHTLWQQGVVPGSPLGLPSSGVTNVTSRLDAQADYGLLAMGGQGMLTPYGGFSLAGRAGRDYRAGARLETDTFNLSLEGMRSERDSGVVDHGLTVQGAVRF